MGFFDQPVSSPVPNPEPPETTLIRDMLARKSFDLQGDPFGGNQMRSNSLTPAPAFAGSGYQGPNDSHFFYGDSPFDEPGQQGETEPRMRPIQAGMPARATRTLSRPAGHFYDDMSAAKPNRDMRSALMQLLARIKMRNGPQGPSRGQQRVTAPHAKFDGGYPSADLPGFDGEIGPSRQELHAMALANGGRPPRMDQLQGWMDKLPGMGINATANPGQGMTFSGPRGGSYTSTGSSHEGGGPGGQSQFLYSQFGINPKGKASGAGFNFDPMAYGKVAGLDYLMGKMAQMQRRSGGRGPTNRGPSNPLPPAPQMPQAPPTLPAPGNQFTPNAPAPVGNTFGNNFGGQMPTMSKN